MIGRLIKGVGGVYSVFCENRIFECSARGTIRQTDKLIVGDFVEFDEKSLTIDGILPRKNFLLRPSVCNIDRLLFLIAPIPKPDFLLIDKIIIKCTKEKVDLLLCINKTDIADANFVKRVEENYCNVSKILAFSALSGENLQLLKEKMQGKLCCLAGQSAVGKSSTLNSLFPNLKLKTNVLSKKIDRGQHTTRHSEIFILENCLICDTPGFSNFEIDTDKRELAKLYPDFEEHSHLCQFASCVHITEPNCQIKQLVGENKISKERYERYKELYEKY